MEDEPKTKIVETKETRDILSTAQLAKILRILNENGLTTILPQTIIVLDSNNQEVDRIPGPTVLSPDPLSE